MIKYYYKKYVRIEPIKSKALVKNKKIFARDETFVKETIEFY